VVTRETGNEIILK